MAIRTFKCRVDGEWATLCQSCGKSMFEPTGIVVDFQEQRTWVTTIYLCKDCLNELATKSKRLYYTNVAEEDYTNINVMNEDKENE